MIDITIQPLSVQFSAPDDDNATSAQIGIIFGTPLPFDNGSGGPVVAPLGILRIPFDKKSLESISASTADLATKLKEPSNITLATSLDSVDAAARAAQNLRG